MARRRAEARQEVPEGIVEGDCLELAKQLPDGSVDLVVTDPPFNIGEDYDDYDDGRPADEYLDWCEAWMTEILRVLKRTGTFWLMIGPKFVSELDIVAKSLGFRQRNHVCWYYTFGPNNARGFTPSKTHLLYFTKSTKFTFHEDEIRVPSARQMMGDKRANPDGRLPDDTWFIRPSEFEPADYDLMVHSRIAGTFKARAGTPNQVPEQLVGRIIRGCSDPGDLVADFFAGSGTIPTVAKKLGRRCVGFELSQAYAQQAEFRLAACAEGDPLDAPCPRATEGGNDDDRREKRRRRA